MQSITVYKLRQAKQRVLSLRSQIKVLSSEAAIATETFELLDTTLCHLLNFVIDIEDEVNKKAS